VSESLYSRALTAIEMLEAEKRVQAEQIAALQEVAEAARSYVQELETEGVANTDAIEAALALAEGCAVDTVPPHIGTGVPLVKGPTMSAAVNRPPFGSYTAETCPDRAKHTSDPAGYIAWHERAEKKAKTHDQHQCPTCGYRVIWKRKSKSVSAPAEKETR
jgi:DNA-directed RNA polymerase subunit RPC12/RpoP